MSGLVPIVPSSVSAGSGTASISDYQVNFTSVSDVTLNDIFSSAYTNYMIQIVHQHSTTATVLVTGQLTASGTPNTATEYDYQRGDVNSGSLVGSRVQDATQWVIGRTFTSYRHGLTAYLFRPAIVDLTSFRSLSGQTENYAYGADVCGLHTVSAAYDGIKISTNGGTPSGMIQVFGFWEGQ